MLTFRFLSIAVLVVSSLAAPSTPSGLVHTPHGLRDASVVHEVPGGSKIRQIDSKTFHVISKEGSVLKTVKVNPEADARAPSPTTGDAPVPLQTGWVALAHYFNRDVPIGSFASTWSVPPNPAANHGQVLFLFNCIEPGSGNAILQPVLQWGRSAAGGGAYWAIATWYLSPAGTFHTPLINVNVGQVLSGGIGLIGVSSAGFSYFAAFTNIGDSTRLDAINGDELKWATVTLESYNIQSKDDYPTGSTVFSRTNLQLTNGGFPNINWATVSDTADNIITTIQTQGSTAAVITITY
ncbi:hypothetical protein MIND_00995700 [Mycena indigotica]|uniref:Uncharacterized protein n=1 Tax=Mycena indigotica TaxID=2126181 RepID=A0A8H6S903_9AGAR|nr:uncharacterized protein MIND_00995700 [Mycena indigotica]KAF7294592.1 hypothetical protein MIND_00995700 [Mycena indigotica]